MVFHNLCSDLVRLIQCILISKRIEVEAYFKVSLKQKHLSGEFALPVVSAYVNLNNKHHKIDSNLHLVKSSINEYLNPGFEKGICNQEIVKSIISEIGSLFEYKQFIKNASLSFADNKIIH